MPTVNTFVHVRNPHKDIPSKYSNYLSQKFNYDPFWCSNSTSNGPRMKPSFMVLGVAKSATTSLHNLLLKHPSILPPLVKEPGYWLDGGGIFRYTDIGEYEYVFPCFPPNESDKSKFVTFESTAFYFTGLKVQNIARLKEWSPPTIKFVVLVRDPIDRAFSQFKMFLYNNMKNGNGPSWSEEMTVESQVASLFNVTVYNKVGFCGVSLAAGEVCHSLYDVAYKNWLQVFTKERFLFVHDRDLIKNTESTLNNIFKFLSLPPQQYETLTQVKNENPLPYEMHPLTKEFLREFYKRHNTEFFKMIGKDLGWNEN
eukprot:TRINITY_DN873_c0_g1_i1.p1 TRINITY_DN873_c0_g1~~TRINITY_DN873_c0_g1_i1.p1  ORF type:complete len:312 (+),score=64.80 TRINITY_DN873_c0_g1_i1:910-1845(+)